MHCQSCSVTAGLGNVLFVTLVWCEGSQTRGGAEKPEKVPGSDSWLCLNLPLTPAGKETTDPSGHRSAWGWCLLGQAPSGYFSAAYQAPRLGVLSQLCWVGCTHRVPGTTSHPPSTGIIPASASTGPSQPSSCNGKASLLARTERWPIPDNTPTSPTLGPKRTKDLCG